MPKLKLTQVFLFHPSYLTAKLGYTYGFISDDETL